MTSESGRNHSELRHPIGVVTARTGISPDVLRAWERRYGAVLPTRDPAGQRLYSDEDIERLRLLRDASAGGRSIGNIARAPLSELRRMVEEDVGAAPARFNAAPAPWSELQAAIDAARALDAQALTAVLARELARLGSVRFTVEVAAPFLRHVGDEWHAGTINVAQEHLASSVTEALLVSALRRLVPRRGAPRLIVATLPGERHVLGAAAAGVAAAVAGWDTVYLGADVPAADIAAAATACGARAVALSVVYVRDRGELLRQLRELRAMLDVSVAVLVGGPGASAIRRAAPQLDALIDSDLHGFEARLASLAA